MRKYIQSSLAIIALLFAGKAFTQSEVFNIGSVPTYSGCDAIMHDSNGGLVPYSANSDNVITLCAPPPETQINLYFIGFDIADGDELSIYDGGDMTAPLIGIFSGDELLYETISSTTGCLTIHFVSNADANTGDFSVRISCGVPCDYPVALIEAEADTIRICPGETVSFDGGLSFWTQGANLQSWEWDFGDNTSNTSSWPTVTKTYNTPGGYRVRLYLTDDNDCSSANIPEKIVFVSTDYVFNLTSSDNLFCVGNEVLIGTDDFADSGDPSFTGEVQNGNTVTWVETQSVVFDNGVYIPDNQGCLYTDITFNQFGSAVIDDASDFSSIFFNIEHSFVGDIVISIICPTGEVLNIFPENGGSGTFLGEPIDDETGVPGVGYTYTFSPTSTGGTWMDGMGGFGGTIPEGDYEPEGDWADLNGCPLNGTWQLEVCDVVGADDGWVFEFGIQFAPEFYPEVLQFTPQVGNGCDSSFWDNPAQFTSVGSDCDWATFNPQTGGVYTFTYHVINDFGCEYTDNITITAIDEPIVEVDDAFFCSSPITLVAEVTNPITGVNYAYSWSPATGLSNANSSSPVISNLNAETTYTVTVSVPGLGVCEGTDDAFVGISTPIIPTQPDEQFFCEIDFPLLLESADQTNENVSYQWVWNNENGSNVVGDTQNHDAIGYGQYVLTISESECNTSQTVTYYITPPPPANAGETFYYCNTPVNLNGSVDNPVPGLNYGYSWSPAEYLNNANIANPLIIAPIDTATVFTLTIYPTFDNTCTSTDSVEITLPQLPNVGTLSAIYPCTEELPYTVYGAAQTIPNLTYEWVFTSPDTTINYGDVTSVTASLAGAYVLTITEPACGYSVEQNIGVFPQICTLFIPNIMTPNGDGDNDTFNVRGVNFYSGSTVQIFNRWGGLVFEDKDYDGTWAGEDMPEGTYYYILGINKQTGMEYYSGHLTLIR